MTKDGQAEKKKVYKGGDGEGKPWLRVPPRDWNEPMLPLPSKGKNGLEKWQKPQRCGRGGGLKTEIGGNGELRRKGAKLVPK